MPTDDHFSTTVYYRRKTYRELKSLSNEKLLSLYHEYELTKNEDPILSAKIQAYIEYTFFTRGIFDIPNHSPD